jgi:methylenetetrahydrofolate--tRNA-(uracil-5-)-methyltransferase
MTQTLHIIGGGMAGSEAAWQAANMGVQVVIHEMRPKIGTFAHQTGISGRNGLFQFLPLG